MSDTEDTGADGADIRNEAPTLTDVEELAVEMGWKPKADYAGPEEKWKPAKDFILAEREIGRGMKQRMRGLQDQLDRMATAATKQTERALKRQAEELQQQFNDAVANRDTEGAAKAVKELQDLQVEAANQAPTRNVEQDFATRNPWYGTDDEATAYAISVSQREAAKGKSHSDQIAAVETSMRKRFPELMGEAPQAQQKPPAAVNAPSRTQAKARRGYGDLPPDVRAAADRFAQLFHEKHKVDPEKAKADYARDYWADRAA